jgi:dTMP kinase
MNGKLIVIEGPDGVGKTTLAKHLYRELPGSIFHSFPGNIPGSLGAHIYDIHHWPQESGITKSIPPLCKQLLHITAHIDLIENYIKPELDDGHIIILDRYWWSTWVYGVVYGADREQLIAAIRIEQMVWADYKPTMIPDQWQELALQYDLLTFQSGEEVHLIEDYESGGKDIKEVTELVKGIVNE